VKLNGIFFCKKNKKLTGSTTKPFQVIEGSAKTGDGLSKLLFALEDAVGLIRQKDD